MELDRAAGLSGAGPARAVRGRLVEWHGYRDGVGEPVSPARMLGRPAGSLQVPHRRAEAVERVAGRESVAVPYHVGEGSGVSTVLAASASGYGQPLRAAKSPVQVAALGLEGHRRQLRAREPDASLARLQLANDRFLDFIVHPPESAARPRPPRDQRSCPVIDCRALPLEEVRQEISRCGEAGQGEPIGHFGTQSLVGCEGSAVARCLRRLRVRVLASIGQHRAHPHDGEGKRCTGGGNRSGRGRPGRPRRPGASRQRGDHAQECDADDRFLRQYPAEASHRSSIARLSACRSGRIRAPGSPARPAPRRNSAAHHDSTRNPGPSQKAPDHPHLPESSSQAGYCPPGPIPTTLLGIFSRRE